MADEYSLADVLERMYQNQLGLEAALMELTLHAEKQGLVEVSDNVRGALWAIGENAGHIKQGQPIQKRGPTSLPSAFRYSRQPIKAETAFCRSCIIWLEDCFSH